MADGDGTYYPPVSVLKAGFLFRCPRCGRGKLFSGYLRVASRCGACGLDLEPHDSADGPAVFVMFIVGAIVVALAFWLEFTHAPPYCCLLYTSPSPRDGLLSRMPSSA